MFNYNLEIFLDFLFKLIVFFFFGGNKVKLFLDNNKPLDFFSDPITAENSYPAIPDTYKIKLLKYIYYRNL
jgi:hypothetical protein